MKMGRDGSISISPGRDRGPPAAPDGPPPRDRRGGGDEGDEGEQ
jgi:penicillin-binding protein 1A